MFKIYKIILCAFIIFVFFVLESCFYLGVTSQYVDASFFFKGKMAVKESIKNADNTWFLPIELPHKNSALVVDKIKYKVKENDILIRAYIASVVGSPSMKEGINLDKIKDGVYRVKYPNSDNSTVDVGEIEIKN